MNKLSIYYFYIFSVIILVVKELSQSKIGLKIDLDSRGHPVLVLIYTCFKDGVITGGAKEIYLDFMKIAEMTK